MGYETTILIGTFDQSLKIAGEGHWLAVRATVHMYGKLDGIDQLQGVEGCFYPPASQNKDAPPVTEDSYYGNRILIYSGADALKVLKANVRKKSDWDKRPLARIEAAIKFIEAEQIGDNENLKTGVIFFGH